VASLGGGKPLVRLPGIGMARACAAVLSVFPLDPMVAQPIAYMQVGGSEAGYRSALQREVIDALVARGDAAAAQCEAMERFAFYDRVLKAYAIVQTGELQTWANFIFKKGIIAEELRA